MNIICGNSYIFRKEKINEDTFDAVLDIVRSVKASAIICHTTRDIYVILYNCFNKHAYDCYRACKADHINQLDPWTVSLFLEFFGLPAGNDCKHLILSDNNFTVFNL